MNKAIAKVNQNEFNRYENLFNTAYVVTCISKHPAIHWPHSTGHVNGLHLGSEHLCRGTCVNFIKTISEVLRNHAIDHKTRSIAFNCIQTPITDQEAILLRKDHSATHEPATVFASIKCLKRTGQVGFRLDK